MAGPETRTRGLKSPGKERREARVPIARDAGHLASAPACEQSQVPVPRKHRAPVGAPPPLTGWRLIKPRARDRAARTSEAARRIVLVPSKLTSLQLYCLHIVFFT